MHPIVGAWSNIWIFSDMSPLNSTDSLSTGLHQFSPGLDTLGLPRPPHMDQALNGEILSVSAPLEAISIKSINFKPQDLKIFLFNILKMYKKRK